MSEMLARREPLPDATLEVQVARDLILLESAGRQWRWLGWLWFFGGIVVSLPLLARLMIVVLNVNNVERMLWAGARLLFVLGLFLGTAKLYFFIARRLARGQRWAAGVALVLAAAATTTTSIRILYRILHRQHDIGGMVIDSSLLVAHLNLLKLLYQSYSAARRVRHYASLRLDAEELR